MNWLIVAGGGNGERMNSGFNKIFAKIRGLPIVYWTIKSLQDNPSIDKIIICVKKNDILKIKKIIKKYKFKKIIKIIEAEELRQKSTYKILQWLKTKANDSDLIGIHNAVNPFVKREEIENVYLAAKKYGAALLAYPATDTIKITTVNGFTDKTPTREFCWCAQTPQVANFKSLLKAFTEADKNDFLGTDDTQILEKVGIKAKIIQCSYRNFKITFPEDLFVAKEILKLFENKDV